MASEIVVRYAETDQMGIVHHSVYPVWYEVARTDFIKSMGMSYTDIENKGIMMPVVEVKSKYISSAHYEDKLSIEVKIKQLNPVKVEFEYSVFKENICINRGTTLHAWTDKSLKLINLKKFNLNIYKLIESAFVQA